MKKQAKIQSEHVVRRRTEEVMTMVVRVTNETREFYSRAVEQIARPDEDTPWHRHIWSSGRSFDGAVIEREEEKLVLVFDSRLRSQRALAAYWRCESTVKLVQNCTQSE
jgi:hypothetical protein